MNDPSPSSAVYQTVICKHILQINDPVALLKILKLVTHYIRHEAS